KAVIVVAGHVACLIIPYSPRLLDHHVPHARPFAVGGGRAFDLIGRRSGAPREFFRKRSGFAHRGRVYGARSPDARRTEPYNATTGSHVTPRSTPRTSPTR